MNRYKIHFLHDEPIVVDSRNNRIVKTFNNYPADYTGMRVNSSRTPGYIEAEEFCAKLNETEKKMQNLCFNHRKEQK